MSSTKVLVKAVCLKGCFWIVLGFITVTLIFILALLSPGTEWCNESMNAGNCQRSQEEDELCYCIDVTMTKSQQLDLYGFSQSQCELQNGTLATLQSENIVLWLSKRMYSMGVDNAMVGLVRLPQVGWYWMQGSNRVSSAQPVWRPDVPSNPEHLHGMLTVRTVVIEDEDNYDYVAYNYDHYIEDDPNYKWFGFVTSDNKPNHALGTYYICAYSTQPESTQDLTTTSMPIPKHDDQTRDECFCSANERVELSSLNASATFTSPRYPKNYCSDNNCKWTVTTREGLAVKLNWIVFSTEKDMDFVYVYDGQDDDSPLLQSCSSSGCEDQKSSGPAMQVHFSADHVITGLGFKFTVSAIEPDACYCSNSVHVSLTNSGEAYVLDSPRYPDPYCPNLNCAWTISAPAGHVVDLKWHFFETKIGTDFLLIYDGDSLKGNCTGPSCSDQRSSGQQMQLAFQSHSSVAAGFRAVAMVIKNYCAMHAHHVPVGNVTSSQPPREDGYIAAGTRVTVTCPPKYKIQNTVDDLSDTATCVAPQWTKLLASCVPVCQIKYSVDFPLEGINICDFGLNIQTTLLEEGHDMTIRTYDYVNGNILAATNKYTCAKSGWSVEQPTCHPMGILTVGGSLPNEQRSAEFYTPNNNMSTSRLLPTELVVGRQGHAAAAPGDGAVFMIGKSANTTTANPSEFAYKPSYNLVEFLDINNESSIEGPPTNYTRGGAGAAVFQGSVFVCGGKGIYYVQRNWGVLPLDTTDSCESFQNGRWSTAASMTVRREGLALVPIGQWLYAIGGRDSYELRSVEKYSVDGSKWKSDVASMQKQRADFGAAAMNGYIYVCGGDGDDFAMPEQGCERYWSPKNEWQRVSPMSSTRFQFTLVAFDGALYALGGQELLGRPVYDIIEKYQQDKWSYEGQLAMPRLGAASVVTSFIGNIPPDGHKSNTLPYALDLGQLAKLTETEPELLVSAPVVGPKTGSTKDSCACLSNEGIALTKLEESKTLQSPGYPEQYCDNQRCLWTISTALGNENLAIQLEWISFSTENQMDMVFIYEGDDDVRLIRTCTGSQCQNLLSKSNTMQIYFTSDHVASDIGFQARVTAIDPDPCYCSHLKNITLTSAIETYTVLSPNHPKSYCASVNYNCKWIITGVKDYGLRVMWDFFNLGDTHVLKIYDGKDLMETCTRTLCPEVVSRGEELSIQFTSTTSNSQLYEQQAFSATISVIRNYCHQLSPHSGTIEYDTNSSADGTMPVGTQALFTCPPNYSTSDDTDKTSRTLVCTAPHWSPPLPICVPVCEVKFVAPPSWDDVHLCAFDNSETKRLVPHGGSISLERYDFTNDQMLSEPTLFQCNATQWTAGTTPNCNKIGILSIGTEGENKATIEVYSPLDKQSNMIDLELQKGGGRQKHMSLLLTDGRVLVVGGFIVPQQKQQTWVEPTPIMTEFIDLSAHQISPGANLRAPRQEAAAAMFEGEVYVCGGWDGTYEDFRTCEVLRNGKWQQAARMKTERVAHAMVASKDALFVIGGEHLYPYRMQRNTVEKYSTQSQSWQYVAPMPYARAFLSAAHFNGVIVACGGGKNHHYDQRATYKTCLKYLIDQDVWLEIASMPLGRMYFNMVTFAGRIYVLGGETDGVPTMAIHSLDMATEQWKEEGQLQLARIYASAVLVPIYD